MKSAGRRHIRALTTRIALNPQAVDEFFRFRRSLFVDGYGWCLPVTGGRETDEFDTEAAVYSLLYLDSELVGGFRAIRTDNDYLSCSIFPHLAGLRTFPRSVDIWEISRFGVAQQGNSSLLARINYSVMLGFARQRHCTSLVAVTDLSHERFLSIIGIRTRRFGPPAEIGFDRSGRPLVAVAGEIPMNEQNDDRFPNLLELARSVEMHDETLVFGRQRVSA